MHHFCTYFDQHYLPRGLALYASLRQHCAEFTLWVLCMDDAAYATMQQLNLQDVRLIALAELEAGEPDLVVAKATRSRIEYYFTCTPVLPLYILQHRQEVEMITYLDADLWFFADPAPLFAEIGANSVAIIGHRFPPQHKQREEVGIYNVGWLTFRRDADGLECLHWWRARCIEWCYDRVEPGRYGDQKYLDDWPTRFRNVVVIQHKGANLAPWNLANYRLTTARRSLVQVDREPLIFFHFQALRQVKSWLYRPNLAGYGIRQLTLVRRAIYAPYIRSLRQVNRQLAALATSTLLSSGIRRPTLRPGSPWQRLRSALLEGLRMVRDLALGRYIILVNDHVL